MAQYTSSGRALCYEVSDTMDLRHYSTGGCLTTSKTEIIFPIHTDKSIEKISSFELSDMNASVRHADGGYIFSSSSSDPLSYGSYTLSKVNNHLLYAIIRLSDTTLTSSFTNNSTVFLVFVEGTLTFVS